MREIILIRHGKTFGKTLGRYIGITDEELCPEGREELAALRERGQYRSIRPDLVYVSPLRRCRQTAELLFPGVPQEICRDLRECDFGEFENKNYKELSGNPAYQAWVDSGGTLPFPGGESREAFQERCRAEFARFSYEPVGPENTDSGSERQDPDTGSVAAMRSTASCSTLAYSPCSWRLKYLTGVGISPLTTSAVS